jgi:hypothetical protein
MKRKNVVTKAINKISNPKRRLIPARMGSGKDYVSISTGIPNKIWVTYEGSGQIAQVWNLRLPSVAGLRVLVGEDPNYPGLLQVIRERLQPGGTPITQLGAHHETHEIYGSDKVNVSGNQIIPLNVVPIAGTFTVIIKDAIILAGDVWAYVNPQNLDLTSSVPAAGALWALIQSDASGVCTLKLSDTVTAKALLTIDGIPLPDNAFFPLCAVRLYAGQTELRLDSAINDFKDLRWGQGSGAGAPTISTTNVIVDGTFDGTTAWVVGTPIEWVISGGKATATDATVTRLSQYVPPVLAGYTYKVTYTVDSISEGSVIVIVGNTEGTPRDAAGTYTEYIFAAATSFDFAPHDTPLTCVIDDVSAEIITGIIPQTPNRIVISDADGIVGSSDNLSYDDTINNLTMGGNNPPWAAEPDTIINSAEGHSFGITGMVFSDDVTKSDYRTTLRAGGTASAPTKVLDGMIISRWRGRGYYDNTGGVADTRVEMRLVADGDWSATSTPTRIEMYTTPVDATVPVLVITLESDGTVNIPTGSTYNINGTPHTHAGGSAHEIRSNGTPMTARSGLNFIGGTVDDNAGADSTDVTITGGDFGYPDLAQGAEEITNGAFDSALTDWTAGAGWTWQSDDGVGGWARHTAGNAEPIYQGGTLINNLKYKALFTYGGGTAGTIQVIFDDGESKTYSASVSPISVIFVGSYTESIPAKIVFYPSSDYDGYIDSVYVYRGGYIQDAANDSVTYGRNNSAWVEITGGGVAPVDPSVVGNLVSFADIAGGQADSGIAAADLFGYPDLATGALELTNGGFTSDASGWNVGAGWAWESDGGGGGRMRHTAGNTAELYQSGILENGILYRVGINDIGGGTAGSIDVVLDDGAAWTVNFDDVSFGAIGLWYEWEGKIIKITPSSNFDGYVTGVSVYRQPFIQDALGDSKTYGRKNNAWEEITGGGVAPVDPSVVGNLVSFADVAGAQADSGIAAADVSQTGHTHSYLPFGGEVNTGYLAVWGDSAGSFLSDGGAIPHVGSETNSATTSDPLTNDSKIGWINYALYGTTLVASTFTQIKAFLKTYFDGLYNNYVHPNHSGDVTSVADGATTIAAKAVDVAMLADGTDGELITWGADGVATTVPVGTATHVLTSNGAGAAPTFQAPAAAGALTSAHIFVGNVSNVAADVAMSGDASITNAGVVSVNKTRLNVRNETGVSIATTKAVYVSGFNNLPLITLATNAAELAHNVIGVTVGAIAHEANGYVATSGQFDAETNGWTVGTELYLSTAGALTDTAPTSGSMTHVAVVTVQANYPTGKLLIYHYPEENYLAGGAGVDTIIRMGDAIGANKTSFRDYANTEVAAVNSDGVFTAASFNGLLTTDKTKLDGIEAAADVTDATNVAAAGAGMVGTANTWVTGQIFGNGVGNAGIIVNGGAGYLRQLVLRTNAVTRAIFLLNGTAEGGANAGSDVQLNVYDDAGANGLTAMLVKRSTGQVRIGSATAPAYPLDVTGDINSSTAIKVGGTALVTNATHSGDVTGATALTIANKITMTGTSPVAVSGSPTVIAAGAVAVSLVNDAAAAITQFDTATLSALDTDVPTSKAVGTAISTHAALRTGVHGMGASYQIIQQGNPTAETTGAVTVTIAKMLTGIVSGNPSAARAYTLDTGANCDGGMTISTNEAFDWVLINLATTATYIITLTAAAGHTIVGNPLIAAQSGTTGGLWGTSSAMFRTRKTAANTFITYRIA